MRNEDDSIKEVDVLYINGAEIMVSSLDISIATNLTTSGAELPGPRLFMSPEFAKGLVVMLGNAVEQYERDHGAIRDVSKLFGRNKKINYSTAGVQ